MRLPTGCQPTYPCVLRNMSICSLRSSLSSGWYPNLSRTWSRLLAVDRPRICLLPGSTREHHHNQR